MLEGPRRHRIVAFVKQENRHAVEAQFAGELAQPVDILLHRIADKDHGIDPPGARFAKGMGQHALDLGLAAETEDPAHDPGRSAAFDSHRLAGTR